MGHPRCPLKPKAGLNGAPALPTQAKGGLEWGTPSFPTQAKGGLEWATLVRVSG